MLSQCRRRKSSKRPAQLNHKLFSDLMLKEDSYKKEKLGHVTKADYSTGMRIKIQKAKAQVETELARDRESNKSPFY